MKTYIFSIIIGVFLTISQVSAGLFEYYTGESTQTNASSEESSDAVETLDIREHPNKVNSYPESTFGSSYSRNSYNSFSGQSYTNYNYTNSQYYSQNRYRNIAVSSPYVYKGNTYYRYDTFINALKNQRNAIRDEAESLNSSRGRLEQILRSRTYGGFNRRALEEDLYNIILRKEYLDATRIQLNSTIRNLETDDRKQLSRRFYRLPSKNYYSSNQDIFHNDYYRFQNEFRSSYSYADRFSQNNSSNNLEDNFGFYSEYYDWVNPYLEEVQDGRIYIK